MTVIRKTSVLLAGCIVLAACSPAQEDADRGTEETLAAEETQASNVSRDAETLLKEIRSLAGVARASDPAQCKVVGLRPKPCGGFERYLVYSTERAQEDEMLQAVENYNALIEQQNQQNDMVSDCQYTPRPRTVLSGDLCTTMETATQ